MNEELDGFEMGARVGMFDKCNGKLRRSFDKVEMTGYNVSYIDGYHHAYEANERRI